MSEPFSGHRDPVKLTHNINHHRWRSQSLKHTKGKALCSQETGTISSSSYGVRETCLWGSPRFESSGSGHALEYLSMSSHSTFPVGRDWLLSSLRPPGLAQDQSIAVSLGTSLWGAALTQTSQKCGPAQCLLEATRQLQSYHIWGLQSIQQALSVAWFCPNLCSV